MPQEKKDHLLGFDEKVNTILLIMFVVVVLVLSVKGCSYSRICNRSTIPLNGIFEQDSIIIDTVSFIQ